MIPGIVAASGAQPPFIALPLTYRESDMAGAMTWTRQGSTPHVTPRGFEGDGYGARLLSTTIPDWMAPASAPLTIHASMEFYPGQLKSTAELPLFLGSATTISKLVLAIVPDVVNSAVSQAVIRGGTGGTAFVEKRLGRARWQYRFRTPELEFGGYKARPQGIEFIDANTIVFCAHFEEQFTRVYKMSVATGEVLASFTCPPQFKHLACFAWRSNGDLWSLDSSNTGCRIDLEASFATGQLVVLDVLQFSGITVGSITFATIDGVEYAVIPEYLTSGSPYTYVFPASLLGTTTLTAAQRHKRFTGTPIEIQGCCMRSGMLWFNAQTAMGAGATNRFGFMNMVDIVNHVRNTADGGALVSRDVREACSKYIEGIAAHPVTNEIWTSCEGITAVGSDAGGMGIWSSPMGDEGVVNHYTAEYDGAGTTTIKINGQIYDTMPGVLAIAVAAVGIGNGPTGAPGMTTRYFTGYIANVVIQNTPMTGAQYNAAVSGAHEPNALEEFVIPLVNPGAESAMTGWTASSLPANTYLTYPTNTATVPHSGTRFFSGGTNENTSVYQRATLASGGLSASHADSGTCWAKARWYQASLNSSEDPCGVGLAALNASSGLLAGVDPVYAITPNASGTYRPWYPRSQSLMLPSGTRTLELAQNYRRTVGTNSDGMMDDISMVVYRR